MTKFQKKLLKPFTDWRSFFFVFFFQKKKRREEPEEISNTKEIKTVYRPILIHKRKKHKSTIKHDQVAFFF